MKDTKNLDTKPEKRRPPTEGELAWLGFFFNLDTNPVVLTHVDVDEFGKGVRSKIDISYSAIESKALYPDTRSNGNPVVPSKGNLKSTDNSQRGGSMNN